MAQFIPFAPNVQVLGRSILSLINAIEIGKNTRIEILAKHGIVNVDPEKWYSQEAHLNAFEEIAKNVGSKTIFMIGRAIIENTTFPPEIDSLEKALRTMDMAYKMNYKGGDVGYYKLLNYDPKATIAVLECKNPYLSDVDHGIITAMARRFKPKNSFGVSVELDNSKPTRLNGADSCTFIIEWQVS